MTRILRTSLPALLAAALTASVGCDVAMDDVVIDDPQDAIEQSNGALTMADEDIDFGESDMFGVDDSVPFDDKFATDEAPTPGTTDVSANSDDPTSDTRPNDASLDDSTCIDAAVICEAVCAGEPEPDQGEGCPIPSCACDPHVKAYHLRVGWGQFPGNRKLEEARDWTGRLSLNRGTVIVRRVIAFENNDEVLPRTDRGHVDFRSKTRPHHDGLLLTIVDPNPELDQPVVLTYTSVNATDVTNSNTDTTPVRTTLDIDVEQAARQGLRVTMDGLGNQFVAMGLRRPTVDGCAHGFMRGRWHRVAPRRGVLYGKVTGPRGHKIGSMRGVWGARANGEQVFFGKYINRNGEFRGLFKGRYRDGNYKGRWIHKNGDVGVLGGHYSAGDATTSADERPLGGSYWGRWAETRCDSATDIANDGSIDASGL